MTHTPDAGPHVHHHGSGHDHLHDSGHDHAHDSEHDHTHDHGRSAWSRLRHLVAPHSHDAADSLDTALEASTQGIRAVKISLVDLGVTAILQLAVVQTPTWTSSRPPPSPQPASWPTPPNTS